MSAIEERKALNRLTDAWRRTTGNAQTAVRPLPRPGEEPPPNTPQDAQERARRDQPR